jgi:hypothetical protein
MHFDKVGRKRQPSCPPYMADTHFYRVDMATTIAFIISFSVNSQSLIKTITTLF